ncbi:MAG TPA: tetratricopeptide repeat protein [Solirubrobacteraceae bacterium]|nr:tetratricopeptide repeat protein [Solirubrobacteraceae bacterium]
MLEKELYATWSAINDEGRHGENLRILERLIDAEPRNADLQLLSARTLLAMDRNTDSLAAVRRAIAFGSDDPAVLVQAASMAFYAGDLTSAREAIESAKKIAPQRFALRKDLNELDRNVARRTRGTAMEARLVSTFELHPEQAGVAAELAQHFARNGQRYAAYHVIMRGLRYHPSDHSLRRLERRLSQAIPPDTRHAAHAWAHSDLPLSVDNANE